MDESAGAFQVTDEDPTTMGKAAVLNALDGEELPSAVSSTFFVVLLVAAAAPTRPPALWYSTAASVDEVHKSWTGLLAKLSLFSTPIPTNDV
jgi:hypothetical protein